MIRLRRHLLLTLQGLDLLLSLEIILGLPLRRILLHGFEPILEGADDSIELHTKDTIKSLVRHQQKKDTTRDTFAHRRS